MTNRKETYYPPQKRFWYSTYSMMAVFFAVLLIEGFFGGLFYSEYWVKNNENTYYTYYKWAIIFVISFSIEMFSSIYLVFSESLTDNENHKTQTDYEDALIMKTLFFKIFNHYSALIFTAFFKGYIYGTCTVSCVQDVKMLLYGIFIVRLILNLKQLITPLFRKNNHSLEHLGSPVANELHGDDIPVLQSGTNNNAFLSRPTCDLYSTSTY